MAYYVQSSLYTETPKPKKLKN